MFSSFFKGFTLAELLIALAILGVIATFTIPKLLQVQADQQKNALTKEIAGALSDAMLTYRMRNGIVPGVSTGEEVFQYMNYLKRDTTSSFDAYPVFSGIWTCSTVDPCIRLHNGGLLMTGTYAWAGNAPNNAIRFVFDPDGKATGANDSVSLSLYADGAVRSRANLKPNTEYDAGTIRGPEPTGDPTWLSW